MLEGGGFSQPLAETELFPGAAKQMFKVGEETGTLDKQLEVASIYFDRELESRIKKFTTMFEPIMIIFVGVIVGFVAVALVSAMYGVLDGVKEALSSGAESAMPEQVDRTADRRRSPRPCRRRGTARTAAPSFARPCSPAIITTPTTAPIRKPKNSPTGTIARIEPAEVGSPSSGDKAHVAVAHPAAAGDVDRRAMNASAMPAPSSIIQMRLGSSSIERRDASAADHADDERGDVDDLSRQPLGLAGRSN